MMTSQCSFCAAACTLLAQRASDSEPVLITMTPILRGLSASFADAPKEPSAKQRLKPTVPAINLENFIVFLPLNVLPLKSVQADARNDSGGAQSRRIDKKGSIAALDAIAPA